MIKVEERELDGVVVDVIKLLTRGRRVAPVLLPQLQVLAVPKPLVAWWLADFFCELSLWVDPLAAVNIDELGEGVPVHA